MTDGLDRPMRKAVARNGDKPPMPDFLRPEAEAAKRRGSKRPASPGVAVAIEPGARGWSVTSPHADYDAWLAMLCDALGTRSESTARIFARHLSSLCAVAWAGPDASNEAGRWVPDEAEANMVLAIVTGTKPRNEAEAMLVAQMVAVHLMQLRASSACLRSGIVGGDMRTAAMASKLARTFAI